MIVCVLVVAIPAIVAPLDVVKVSGFTERSTRTAVESDTTNACTRVVTIRPEANRIQFTVP